MLEIRREQSFLKTIGKIKDNSLKERIKKQVRKIVENPEIGKPMRYGRKGTRELYVPPFRISYTFNKQENLLIFLDIYHKDRQ
jgi:mRNA-degrading endonuclease RelE of RelBE toxin-antitoxin system